ncbi:MAG: hypothetical protein ABIE43_04330 [Patescibacteria group bacterium]
MFPNGDEGDLDLGEVGLDELVGRMFVLEDSIRRQVTAEGIKSTKFKDLCAELNLPEDKIIQVVTAEGVKNASISNLSISLNEVKERLCAFTPLHAVAIC